MVPSVNCLVSIINEPAAVLALAEWIHCQEQAAPSLGTVILAVRGI